MVEKILAYERDLFFMLNGSDSPFLDRFMWLFSGKAVWLPLAAFILIVLLYKKKWKESILILLGIVLVVTLCDQFASHVCKPIFTRFRPTHHPDFMDQVKTVFDYRGGRYGFISSHAANAFGFATYMSLLFRYRLFTWTIFLWAALTAYTRVYIRYRTGSHRRSLFRLVGILAVCKSASRRYRFGRKSQYHLFRQPETYYCVCYIYHNLANRHL